MTTDVLYHKLLATIFAVHSNIEQIQSASEVMSLLPDNLFENNKNNWNWWGSQN